MAQVRDEILKEVKIPRGNWRNFSGVETKYNAAGKRNFNAFLTDEDAKKLKDAGWNVRYTKTREEGDIPQPYIKVNVNFGGKYPPKVVSVQGPNKVDLDDTTVKNLDGADIEKAILILHPYVYDDEGHIAAYLREGMFICKRDYLEEMYSELVDDGDESAPF